MRDSILVTDYLDKLVALLSTPLGLTLLVLVLAAAALMVVTSWAKWLAVMVAMYAASLPVAEANMTYARLASPLNEFRENGRLIEFGALTLLLLPLMTAVRGWRSHMLTVPLVLFFIFELSVVVRGGVYGNVARALFGGGGYVLMLLTLGLAVSRWLQTIDDFDALMWAIAGAGGLAVISTCYQVVVNRSLIVTGNRLIGVTGNPQIFAVMMAFTLTVACYLLIRSGGRKWLRALLIVDVAVTIPLLVWTGSRTGALTAAVGLLCLFYRRLGRLALWAPVLGFAVVFALPYFEGSSKIASRLISNENTRGAVWADMTSIFGKNVLFGASTVVLNARENSYLSALADLGLIGALPLFAAMAGVAAQIVYLVRHRRSFGPHRTMVDLLVALWVSIGLVALFEGLLLGVTNFPVLLCYTLSGATAFLIDWSRQEPEPLPQDDSPFNIAA